MEIGKTNQKIFCKIWNKYKEKSMVFITSNSGTGKTTFFKWLFIRRALKHNETFDVFYRWADDLDKKFNNESFLTLPDNASKRLIRLANKVEIIKEDDKLFLVEKEKQRKLARALAVNTQSKIKSTENEILSCRALFDECLADDNFYCSDECYKFARLIDTRARARQYQVFALYNNTNPNFPYADYFKNSGALFIKFVANKWGETDKNKGIQGILRKSKYKDIYENNFYLTYREFYKDIRINKNTCFEFYLKIDNKTFKVYEIEDNLILKETRKVKPNKESLSLQIANSDFYLLQDSAVLNMLKVVFIKRQIFVNKINNTIYLKRLADYLNMRYN